MGKEPMKEYLGMDALVGAVVTHFKVYPNEVVLSKDGHTLYLEIEYEYDTFGGCSCNLRVFRNKLDV